MLLVPAITAFFNFLSTPAGQAFATAMLAADQTFNSKLGDLFNVLHAQTTTTSTSTTTN